MAKFILHEDMEIFTTHGSIFLKDLYNRYVESNFRLPSDLVAAGVKRGREYRFNILSMQEIYINDSCEVILQGARIASDKIYVHPKQKIWSTDGREVSIVDLNPFTTIVAKNGALMVSSVGQIDKPKRFFIIETGYEVRTYESVPSIMAGNFVLLPLEEQEVDDDNPFLILEKELLEQ